MNKRDVIIAFLLGIICTQATKAEGVFFDQSFKETLLDCATIVAYGEIHSQGAGLNTGFGSNQEYDMSYLLNFRNRFKK